MHPSSTFQHFQRQEIGVPCSMILEMVKRDRAVEEDAANHFGELTFQVFDGRGLRNSTTGIVKL
jgi:hypothetical protein